MFEWKLGLKIVLASVVTAGTGTAAYAYYSAGNSAGIRIPEFVGNDKNTVENWIEKYNTDEQVKLVYDYSEKIEKNIVMDQSMKEGSILNEGDFLQLTVSFGPDPEALFELPDFTGQKKDEIEAWFAGYHFTNVTYTYEAVEDASIETDTFISMNPEAGTEVLRDAQIEVKIVTGDITVPDLGSMSRDEIQAWADQWGITVSFEEEESSILNDGAIVSVSVQNGATVKRGDTITVKIAKHVESEKSAQEEQVNKVTDTNQSAPAGSSIEQDSNNTSTGSSEDQNGDASGNESVQNACVGFNMIVTDAESKQDVIDNFERYLKLFPNCTAEYRDGSESMKSDYTYDVNGNKLIVYIKPYN